MTNCGASANSHAFLASFQYLLRQFGGLHFGFDNLQSDGRATEVFMAQQLCAMADSEAAFAQLRSRFILESLGVLNHGRRGICVYRRGRHWRGGSWREMMKSGTRSQSVDGM